MTMTNNLTKKKVCATFVYMTPLFIEFIETNCAAVDMNRTTLNR